MSVLTLEFAISFLKVLNIDFSLILISLKVVEIAASLNDYCDLVYKLKKIVGSYNFSAQFIKITSHY